jgi:hypothetical protein
VPNHLEIIAQVLCAEGVQQLLRLMPYQLCNGISGRIPNKLFFQAAGTAAFSL